MFADTAGRLTASLTTAELKILQFLPTHLSFREIADRTFVSANTVKTQANADLPQARRALALGGRRARAGARPARRRAG